jgi:hypothetical protein
MANDDVTNQLLRDPKFLRALRKLCPRKRSGCDAIEITSRGETVTLTPETRRKIDKKLKAMEKGKP